MKGFETQKTYMNVPSDLRTEESRPAMKGFETS